MTDKDDLSIRPVEALSDRLMAAAGRVEAHIYTRPVTPKEVRFFLEWADALTDWAARLRESKPE